VRAGFVRRTPSPTDGRVVIVQPTAAGWALRSEVEQIWRTLEDVTAGDLDERERASALHTLERLEANLEQAAAAARDDT
jgi:MarR family transcriptional regulator, organic hydroperoxide resistance regulator